MFRSDYPRALAHCLWLCCFPVFDPLPVTLALAVAFLLATGGNAVLLLRFPPPPLPRPPATAPAAIPLGCLPPTKTLPAPFEHTPPQPRPAPPLATPLVFC